MNDRIDSALGYEKADIVLRNAKYVNVFTNELLDGDIAIKDGYFVGIGDYEGNIEKPLYHSLSTRIFIWNPQLSRHMSLLKLLSPMEQQLL